MTSDFDSDRIYDSDEKTGNGELDCFELLSAYLDNELTPTERNQVQHLLDNEPQVKKMYGQLLHLHSQMQNLTAPPSKLSFDDLSLQVYEKLDRTQRRKKIAVWGGGAIAAALIAALSGLVPGTNSPAWRLVKSPKPETFADPIMLAVAVDKPAVKIPKAAVATPRDE
ncbi:anti-sigma factor family protein [Myxosarcina sp. GI1(2024)]